MKPFIPREWIRMRKQPHAGIRKSPFVKSGLEDGHGRELKAPYSPGEVCWVRETFTTFRSSTDAETQERLAVLKEIINGDESKYSDLPHPTGPVKVLYKSDFGEWADDPDCDLGPWRSPVTMPQWASRRHVRILSCVPEQRDEWGWRIEWEESNAL
jgi:hypothetical protein